MKVSESHPHSVIAWVFLGVMAAALGVCLLFFPKDIRDSLKAINMFAWLFLIITATEPLFDY